MKNKTGVCTTATAAKASPPMCTPTRNAYGARMVVTPTMSAAMGKLQARLRAGAVMWFRGERHAARLGAVMALDGEMQRFMLDTDPPVSRLLKPARVHPRGDYKYEDDCLEVLGAVLGRILAARRVFVEAWGDPAAAGIPGDTPAAARLLIVEALHVVDSAATPMLMRCYNDWTLFSDWEPFMQREFKWTPEQCAAQHPLNRTREAWGLRREAMPVFGAVPGAVETYAAHVLGLAVPAPPVAPPLPATADAAPGGGPLEALGAVLEITLAARRAFTDIQGPEDGRDVHIYRALHHLQISAFALITAAYPALWSFRCRWSSWTKKGAW